MSDMYNYDDNLNKDTGTVSEAKNEGKADKKKKGRGAEKFFGTVVLAVTFGIIASIMFNCTNMVVEKFTNKNANNSAVIEDTKEPDNVVQKDESTDKTIKQYKADDDALLKKLPADEDSKSVGLSISDRTGGMTIEEVANDVIPSIVAITNKSVQEVRSFYSMYGMAPQQYEAESAGSGIIIGQNDTEILIVTNAHVVENANTLSVCFINDEVYEAQIKGTDTSNDLAVISVDLSDMSGNTLDAIAIAAIGNSGELRIGQQVVAIGNALGYGQSVTTGIVSALDRSIVGDENDSTRFIQTDAAINPGNSGGALLNMKGEVIGINSAKLANTKIEGMGYAIPIDVAKPIIDDLMNMVTRNRVDVDKAGYLGISGFSVTDEVAAAYAIPKGIYVSETESGHAAEKAGMQKGDVVLKFDGMSMDSINKLKERLEYYEAGETVDVIIARADDGEYKEKTLRVTLDSREGTSLDTSKEEDTAKQEESDGNGEIDNNPNNRSGEFNFGGSKFQYSIPKDLFDVFGH